MNSKDILGAVLHPDPITGQPSTAQKETYTVNALGQMLTFTDRNSSTHTYLYDDLGRQTSDIITTLGAGVDGSVRRIDTTYDSAGNPYLYTSYSDTAGTNVVNQVRQVYNGFGQVTQEFQSHGGPVNPATTPSVKYAYVEGANADSSRLKSITYPNGRLISYNYSGLDDSISRVTSISDNSATLEQESYLGLGTLVQRAYTQPGVALTYQTGTTNSSAGDQYSGLDQFGRIVDQDWINTVN
jgi:YD repeat-containing protein